MTEYKKLMLKGSFAVVLKPMFEHFKYVTSFSISNEVVSLEYKLLQIISKCVSSRPKWASFIPTSDIFYMTMLMMEGNETFRDFGTQQLEVYHDLKNMAAWTLAPLSAKEELTAMTTKTTESLVHFIGLFFRGCGEEQDFGFHFRFFAPLRYSMWHTLRRLSHIACCCLSDVLCTFVRMSSS